MSQLGGSQRQTRYSTRLSQSQQTKPVYRDSEDDSEDVEQDATITSDASEMSEDEKPTKTTKKSPKVTAAKAAASSTTKKSPSTTKTTKVTKAASQKQTVMDDDDDDDDDLFSSPPTTTTKTTKKVAEKKTTTSTGRTKKVLPTYTVTFPPPCIFSPMLGRELRGYLEPFVEDVHGFDMTTPCQVGIDEAGRGPVLGSMVYGTTLIPLHKVTELKALGVNDSKQLKESDREYLLSLLQDATYVRYCVDSIPALDISANMLHHTKTSLNEVSFASAVNLVFQYMKAGFNVVEVYADTVGPADKYRDLLLNRLADLCRSHNIRNTVQTCVVESKADATYPVVSAASICAKVTRDMGLTHSIHPEEQRGLKITRDFGSGYPGDEVTKAWLRKHMHPVFGFPSLVRFSWGTAVALLDEFCRTTTWGDIQEDPKDPKAAAKSATQLTAQQQVKAKAKSMFFKSATTDATTTANGGKKQPIYHKPSVHPLLQRVNRTTNVHPQQVHQLVEHEQVLATNKAARTAVPINTQQTANNGSGNGGIGITLLQRTTSMALVQQQQSALRKGMSQDYFSQLHNNNNNNNNAENNNGNNNNNASLASIAALFQPPSNNLTTQDPTTSTCTITPTVVNNTTLPSSASSPIGNVVAAVVDIINKPSCVHPSVALNDPTLLNAQNNSATNEILCAVLPTHHPSMTHNTKVLENVQQDQTNVVHLPEYDIDPSGHHFLGDEVFIQRPQGIADMLTAEYPVNHPTDSSLVVPSVSSSTLSTTTSVINVTSNNTHHQTTSPFSSFSSTTTTTMTINTQQQHQSQRITRSQHALTATTPAVSLIASQQQQQHHVQPIINPLPTSQLNPDLAPIVISPSEQHIIAVPIWLREKTVVSRETLSRALVPMNRQRNAEKAIAKVVADRNTLLDQVIVRVPTHRTIIPPFDWDIEQCCDVSDETLSNPPAAASLSADNNKNNNTNDVNLCYHTVDVDDDDTTYLMECVVAMLNDGLPNNARNSTMSDDLGDIDCDESVFKNIELPNNNSNIDNIGNTHNQIANENTIVSFHTPRPDPSVESAVDVTEDYYAYNSQYDRKEKTAHMLPLTPPREMLSSFKQIQQTLLSKPENVEKLASTFMRHYVSQLLSKSQYRNVVPQKTSLIGVARIDVVYKKDTNIQSTANNGDDVVEAASAADMVTPPVKTRQIANKTNGKEKTVEIYEAIAAPLLPKVQEKRSQRVAGRNPVRFKSSSPSKKTTIVRPGVHASAEDILKAFRAALTRGGYEADDGQFVYQYNMSCTDQKQSPSRGPTTTTTNTTNVDSTKNTVFIATIPPASTFNDTTGQPTNIVIDHQQH